MHPLAEAYPRPGEKPEPGRYGSTLPMTLANGMMLICRVKPGHADSIRQSGLAIAKAVEANPNILAVLRLHYVRWILFDDDTRFIYCAIFDTDFDKYIEDVLDLFKKYGLTPLFAGCEGFPEDWKENYAAFAVWARQVQAPSFAEYAEYPNVTNIEVVKALAVKQSLGVMLDQMQ
jgi:hypothetical protein